MEDFNKVIAKGGEDKEVKALFDEIGKIVGRDNVKGFLNGKISFTEEQWNKIRARYGTNISGRMAEIEVQIHQKSDPMAAIAGDDTSNCMPFGSGKNTVYTFNTNTGLMTVRLKIGDRWKTISESVLTRDIELNELKHRTIYEFIDSLEKNNGRLDLVLPEEVLEEGRGVIPLADNVEVAKGYIMPKWQRTIKDLYADFWSVYLENNSNGLTNEKKIRAGLGYDDLEGLYDSKVGTKWVPRAMISYSDALGDKLGEINTGNTLSDYRVEVTSYKQERPKQTEISERGNRNGIRYATVDDALAIGWLESRIYNESGAGDFVEGGAAMERMLIATEINNVRKGRQQMSLVHIGERKGKKKMDGYMMAYEGKLYGGSLEMKKYTSNGVLYIEDMAVRQEAKIGAGAMLAEFMELYRKNYLEKGTLMPIYMQARESTSLALLKKQLDGMASSLGLHIRMIGDTTMTGDENERHSILLVPEK